MASTLKFLIPLGFLVCSVQAAMLSKHASDVKKEILSDIKDDVSKSCYDSFKPVVEAINTDSAIESMCDGVQKQKSSIESRCKKSGYADIKKIICKEVKASVEDKADRLLKYAKVNSKLTQTCKTKLGNMANLKTWYDIEQLCDQIGKKDKKDYKKQCPNDDYDDVKKVICGGASSILSGLLTVGLCLMASLFSNKC